MSAAVAAAVSAASTGALEVPLSLGAAPVGLASSEALADPIRNVRNGGGDELAIVRPRNPAGPWLDANGGRRPEGP